ncbi:hypothetical protein JCM19238_3866 [Vibrio ponticus]|nr:hypothetical protein JCM19238_3866 [Vibrio ponticus]
MARLGVNNLCEKLNDHLLIRLLLPSFRLQQCKHDGESMEINQIDVI